MSNTHDSIVYLLKRTELAVRGCVEVALLQFDLTPNQFHMLLRLHSQDGMSAAELARAVGVRPQSIGEIIAPLERKALISRHEKPEHRRILRISLTAAGRQVLARGTRIGLQLEKELVSDLDAAELAALRKGLSKLLASAQQHECHPEVRRLAASAVARAHITRPWRRATSPRKRGRVS
jgi:DNA-binding MarR family transcriptional regulator